MSFSYADFEDIVPGDAVVMLAVHGNELRSAILERAELIDLDISTIIPDALVPGESPFLYSWLTGMRDAIEAIVDQGKYGILQQQYDPVWVTSLEDILTEVHARFSDCGESDAWISVDQYDKPMASHIRELFYVCEAVSFLGSSQTTYGLWVATGGSIYYNIDQGEWLSGTSPYHTTDDINTYRYPLPPDDGNFYEERAYVSLNIYKPYEFSGSPETLMPCTEIYIGNGRSDQSSDPMTIYAGDGWSGTAGQFIGGGKVGWSAFYSLDDVTSFTFSFGPIWPQPDYSHGLGSVLENATTYFSLTPDFIVRPTFERNNALFELNPE